MTKPIPPQQWNPDFPKVVGGTLIDCEGYAWQLLSEHQSICQKRWKGEGGWALNEWQVISDGEQIFCRNLDSGAWTQTKDWVAWKVTACLAFKREDWLEALRSGQTALEQSGKDEINLDDFEPSLFIHPGSRDLGESG